ncbi:MAG: SiaC family regulatory phosphoprotein [Bacteroidales bacterium]|nr:SiaC family regulatory phosphoprotein [Bacteroidales bacterium]MBN2819987.1 SiaC family regulatory phosphoprotein [Bacteroidales bacterium]
MKSLSNNDLFFIESSNNFPEVVFKPNGELSISGRLINDHVTDFFSPLFHWVDVFDGEYINLVVRLEYLNTTGTFHILELARRIESNKRVKIINITWHFEEDDEEHLDLGQLIEQGLKRTTFNYFCEV